MNTSEQTVLSGMGDIGKDSCCICGLAISESLTDAHLNGRQGTARLCWTCHQAYDIDILTTVEILVAESETRAGIRRVDVTAMHSEWRRDLATGKRVINKERQHGRTREQSSANARKAWRTRRFVTLPDEGDSGLDL